ncbi:hypothetical protein CGCSCA4_v009092 [Colletotrichum siamense]|uniref:RNase H type-1 domain-containing protein n=1 Tax=Colletotrichum siamense TaxID=690259 RepID=A0A9P5EDH1_COLSI|nr:hypothetical protein CGCSCA4_v009092 [Colletotrichum siamense]KAF4847227.1 hypothetical protein CGCSCA2_v012841 [Colletotrichum siamense]
MPPTQAPIDRIIDMVFSYSVASHSEHETCFMPEKKPLGVSPPRFPDSHMDAYQGDLAFLESPGPAIDQNGGRFVHLRCYRQDPSTLRYVFHYDSLIIAVSGATANNPNRSAIGVYFGPNNPFNLSLAVPTKYRIGDGGENVLISHTIQRAELYGVIAALNAVFPFTHQYGIESPTNGNIPTTLKHVIIKIESGYIVDKICRMEAQRPLDIHQACEAGKSDRGCLEHCDLWQELRQGLVDLADCGAVVQFWHIPRDQNLEADALANVGLGNPHSPSVDKEVSVYWLRRIKVDSALKLEEYGCCTEWYEFYQRTGMHG